MQKWENGIFLPSDAFLTGCSNSDVIFACLMLSLGNDGNVYRHCSLPVIGDIGKIWPVVAFEVALELGVKLDFISASQDTPEGQAMHEWIANHIKPLNREKMFEK